MKILYVVKAMLMGAFDKLKSSHCIVNINGLNTTLSKTFNVVIFKMKNVYPNRLPVIPVDPHNSHDV